MQYTMNAIHRNEAVILFLKMFQKPGDSLKKWIITVIAISDVLNIISTVCILICFVIPLGILGFFLGLIFSAIYFFLCLLGTRWFSLGYYCLGEMTTR